MTVLPKALPVLAPKPDGISKDKTGVPLARLIALIAALYSPISSRLRPMPIMASTITSTVGSLSLKG